MVGPDGRYRMAELARSAKRGYTVTMTEEEAAWMLRMMAEGRLGAAGQFDIYRRGEVFWMHRADVLPGIFGS